jgi:tetratricopeptide (TPR) repeat protein
VGEVLERIDPPLAVKCYKLYYSMRRNDESKYLLGKTLVNGKELEAGVTYLDQVNYRQYSLEGLLLMGRTYSALRNLIEGLRCFLKIIMIDQELT